MGYSAHISLGLSQVAKESTRLQAEFDFEVPEAGSAESCLRLFCASY